MTETLVKFDEPIMNSSCYMYFAAAIGRQRADDGLWEGLLEFEPVADPGRTILSDRETTQPNRADLEYWAQGLSRVYLQGALARAEAFSEPSVENEERAES